MAEGTTIWSRLAECVAQLDEPFRANEILAWFRQHHPTVNEGSLRAHIQSATSNVEAGSKIAGFAGRTPLITRVSHGLYIRYAGKEPVAEPPPVANGDGVTAQPGAAQSTRDVILVGCSRTKRTVPSPARDLFTGARFTKARAYAEARPEPWFVLSAKWGLLDPSEPIAPYDVYLADQSAAYREAWGNWVVAQLERLVGSLAGRVVEVHASQAYVDPLRVSLGRAGAQLREPLRGLRQGEQLHWYEDHRARDSAVGVVPRPDPRRAPSFEAEAVFRSIGPFTYRWPDNVEEFDTAWETTRVVDGRSVVVRHAVGQRDVYGRRRRHSVTFVAGEPMVESVASDDYGESRSLVSGVKDGAGRLVRTVEDLPEAYAGLPLCAHESEIQAPYSRKAVAVKLREDDVDGWAQYALARLQVKRRTQERPLPGGTSPDAAASSPAQPEPERDDTWRRHPRSTTPAVVAALLVYGAEHETLARDIDPEFTPLEAANRLIIDDPFAFLLAVIFDQGIAAERAWAAPYHLRERLGHLSPRQIGEEPEAVAAAIATPPKLHRYVEILPRWVVAAGRLVTENYGGDAGRIWTDQPRAQEVFARLDAFPGIGQKKAAMAVEILERDLKVPMSDMHGSDIAYDVHVRRVFLRTGIAEYDEVSHMIDAARRAHPTRPGELDYPAWLIGRQWCRPGAPDCAACPLRDVCPKDVAAAARVRGA